MLFRAFAVCLLALAVAGLGLGQSRKKEPLPPREYSSPEFKYRAYFPEKDPTVALSNLKTNAGELKQGTATVEIRDVTYSVTVTLLPSEVVATGRDKVIDGVRDGIKGKDGKVESEGKSTQTTCDTPIREIVFDFRRNQLKTRVMLVEDRLYQVTVTGPKSAVNAKTAEEFLRSFEVTK